MKRRCFLFVFVLAALFAGCSTAGPDPAEAFTEWDQLPRISEGGEDGSGIVAPKAVKRVNPTPDAAFRMKYSYASAKVQAVIGEDGKVIAARPVDGHPEFGRILASAVRKWEFTPATTDGVPTRVLFEMTATYRRN